MSTQKYDPMNHELNSAESGMAIVCNGDTAPKAISSGQYLFIKNHSTLANGGYHATSAIASGASITSSNVTADSDGIANAVAVKVGTVYKTSGTSKAGTNAGSITADKDGFICWLQPATDNFVAIHYMEHPYVKTSNIWCVYNTASAGTTLTNSYRIRCCFLYHD